MNEISKIGSVSVFGQLDSNNLNVAVKENGATSATLLSKKQYGQLNGLKGAALNTAHYEYKREMMGSNAKLVGAALLSGKIGITRLAGNAAGNGGSLSFKAMDAVKEPKQKAVSLDKVITEENAGDVIEKLRALGFNVTLGAAK